MSMHRYANAGPVMHGLAAMSEPADAALERHVEKLRQQYAGTGIRVVVGMDSPIEPMPADPRIAQLEKRIADLEQQLDACQFFNRLMTVEAQVQQISNDVNAWLEQAQAQQTAMLAQQQRQTAAQAFNNYSPKFVQYGSLPGDNIFEKVQEDITALSSGFYIVTREQMEDSNKTTKLVQELQGDNRFSVIMTWDGKALIERLRL